MKKSVKTKKISVDNSDFIPRQILYKDLSVKTDYGEDIIIKITENPQYKLVFQKGIVNDPQYEYPHIKFSFNSYDHLYINDVDAFSEIKIGWCSFMIQTLMNLIKKWDKEGRQINIVSLNNSSIVFGNGNARGTICYIKNIGRLFPWFKYQGIVYDLSKYLETDKDWEEILPLLGIKIFFDDELGWRGGGEYYFYRNNPIKSQESKLNRNKNRKKRSKSNRKK